MAVDTPQKLGSADVSGTGTMTAYTGHAALAVWVTSPNGAIVAAAQQRGRFGRAHRIAPGDGNDSSSSVGPDLASDDRGHAMVAFVRAPYAKPNRVQISLYHAR